MRIIGIDPGTVCCGFGIVEVHDPRLTGDSRRRTASAETVFVTAGDIKMNRKDTLPERLKQLYDSLKTIIEQYRPSYLCIEKIFYHKSIRSAFTLGSTRGVAMLLAAEHSIPVIEYNPTELKMALTGYGRAEKHQVKDMVMRILKLNPSATDLSEDSSDALALCICHVHSYSQRRIQDS
jgi:crossover junction endodeoxyribonuclease RuvC